MSQYSGQWKNDIPHGVGTLLWLEDSGINKVLRNRYEGNFEQGLRNGLGTFYYANGSTYEGNWVNNKKQGYAVYTDENGEVSHCFFINDRLVRKIHVADSLIQVLSDNSKVKSKYSLFKDGKDKSDEASSKSRPLIPNQNSQPDTVPQAPPANRRDRLAPVSLQGQHTPAGNVSPDLTSPANRRTDSPSRIANLAPTLTEAPVAPALRTENTAQNQPASLELVKSIPIHGNPEGGITNDAENLYQQLVDLRDIVSEDQLPRVMHQISEVLLRYHSQMKQWYHACAQDSNHEYEEGFFMDLSGFTKFIYDNRLLNGKANLPNLCRLLAKYGGKEFELHFDQTKIEDEVELMKKYDFESSDIETELSRFEDRSYVHKKIEGLLIEDAENRSKRKAQQYSGKKVLLFRSFVNALVRLVYLKTGSIFKLPSHIDRIFSKRISPLMAGEIKPKKIVHEEFTIISKSKPVVDKFRAELRSIYDIRRARSFKYSEGDMIDIKSVFVVLKEFGLLKYSNLEEQLNTWLIFERTHDPEESVFRLISKLIQKGKPDERIDQRIKPVILSKLHSEIDFDEFCELFILFVCKSKEVSSKLTIFANKLNNTLKTVLESSDKIVKNIKSKPKTVRCWPRTQKDHE